MTKLLSIILIILLFSCSKRETVMPAIVPPENDTTRIDTTGIDTTGNIPPGPDSTVGTFKYKENGQLFTVYSDYSSNREYAKFFKTTNISGQDLPNYTFNSMKYYPQGSSINPDQWIVQLNRIDSLKVQTYIIDSMSIVNRSGNALERSNGRISSIQYSGDYLTINITSHSNGLVSGTFSGKLTPLDGAEDNYYRKGSVIITEGEFKDLMFVYE